jgi:hypothetical protein
MHVDGTLFEGQPVVVFVDFSTFVESEFELAEEGWAIWLFNYSNDLTVLFYLDLRSAARNVAALSDRNWSYKSVVSISNWVDQSGIIRSEWRWDAFLAEVINVFSDCSNSTSKLGNSFWLE